MKKLLAAALLVIPATGMFVVWETIVFLNSNGDGENKEIVVDVAPGKGFFAVANDLEQRKIISSALYFKILARLTGRERDLKVGEYALRSDMKPAEILTVLSSGKSVERPMTIPEGTNMFEVAGIMESKGLGTAKEVLALLQDSRLINELLGENHPRLEGYLFPETYMYTKYTRPETMIRAMVARFFETYRKAMATGNPPGLSRHELVTLASVIEKETGAPEERPLISSVFHNRLKKGMRLQSDPTILYGILVERGVMPENIKKDDILRPNPFNTYTVKALPAGPIGNPGLEALKAAASPAQSEFLYFVSRNDGTHVFSATLDQHNKAVRSFQLDRGAREGKSWRDLKKRPDKK